MIIKLSLKLLPVWLILLFFLPGCQPEAGPVPAAAKSVQSRPASAAELQQAADHAIAAETRAPTGAPPAAVKPAGEESPMPEPTTLADLLPDLGRAPELTNEIWINSEPLTMKALRGKVVLIEFWTFG